MSQWIARAPWLCLLGFALLEVSAHAITRRNVAEEADWQAAAAHVRQAMQPGDMLTAAPGWADPQLRRVLGDRMSLAMAGPSDTAGYKRLWGLSIRGARPVRAPAGKPQEDTSFGAVRVRRWDLPGPVVHFDLVSSLRRASVSMDERPCRWGKHPPARGGGLGKGVLYPTERFQCGRKRPWLFVATVVMEDLDLQPRHCVWQHPAGNATIAVTYDDVPLAERIVFYGGLYYEHERMREGGPVHARVFVDGKLVGQMIHEDGDGWKRLEFLTAGGERLGQIRIEVSAANPRKRSFCWSATVRGPESGR